MNIIPLTSEERRQGGFTHRFIFTHADLTTTAAATGQTITLMTVPAGSMIARLAMRLKTAFADSADAANNTLTVIVGDTSDSALYLASTQLNVNGTEITHKAGTGALKAYPTEGLLSAEFGAPAAGKTLAALNTGELHLLMEIINLNQLAN